MTTVERKDFRVQREDHPLQWIYVCRGRLELENLQERRSFAIDFASCSAGGYMQLISFSELPTETKNRHVRNLKKRRKCKFNFWKPANMKTCAKYCCLYLTVWYFDERVSSLHSFKAFRKFDSTSVPWLSNNFKTALKIEILLFKFKSPVTLLYSDKSVEC